MKLRRHEADAQDIPEDTGAGKGRSLEFTVFAEQIEHDPEKDSGCAAVHDKGVERQQRKGKEVCQKQKDRIRESRHQCKSGIGEKQRDKDGKKPPPPLFLCTPVKSLQYYKENGKGGEHLILREKPVRPHKHIAYVVEGKLYRAHEYGDQIDAQKVFFSVMGVGEALDDAK